MGYRLGIDIGGTFTDFVAYDEVGRALSAWKNLSTPQDPIQGIMTGLRTFGAIDDIAGIRLGTTVATNALLEGKGARVGYVATRGFRDVPFIGRGNRRHHYDLAWVKPKPLLQRRDAFEVDERVGASGDVLTPLDEAAVAALADRIAAEGEIEAVAVVLLHSYLTPVHEVRIRDIFVERLPGVPVSISYEVLPKWKEHFRSSTTICDAFIKPIVGRQLGAMRRQLDEEGVKAKVVVMRSNGGEDESRGRRSGTDPNRGVRADGRRHCGQAHGRIARPAEPCHARHGRGLRPTCRPSSTSKRSSRLTSRSSGAGLSRSR